MEYININTTERIILAEIMKGIEPDGYIEDPQSKIQYPTWRLDKLYLKIPDFVYSFPLLIDYDYSWCENIDFLFEKTKKWFALVETINPYIKLHKQDIDNISSTIKHAFKNSLTGGADSVESIEKLLLHLDNFKLLEVKKEFLSNVKLA